MFLLTFYYILYRIKLQPNAERNIDMIKYKINVADALERVKFNTYKAKTSGLMSQETLKKFQKEDTNVSLKSLNNLCIILDMELKDIITFEITEQEKENRQKILN